jgi:tRNA(adenine34) deaminase
MDDRKLLERALELARESLSCGSGPVGAVIVDAEGTVISEGRNRAGEPWPLEAREIGGSSLAHAEMTALLHLNELDEAASWTIYSSLEPCLMCSGALAFAGVGRIVWACDDPWYGTARFVPWREHPAFERVVVTPHPFADLELEAARLFAPEAVSVYPEAGIAAWRARYPEAFQPESEE